MDVLNLLDKLDDLVYEAKPIPMTDQVRVPREDVYSLLDQIRVSLPEEIKQARWILEERQEMRAEDAGNGQLKAIADSIEELKRSQQRTGPPPLTAAAAEKVRSIIQAAEASATEIREEAESEARRIEADAARRGVEIRRRSAAEAEVRLKRADDVTRALLEEAGTASASLEALLDRVREPAAALADALGEGNDAIRSDLDRMRARMAEEAGDGGAPVASVRAGGSKRPRAGEAARARAAAQETEEWDGLELPDAAGTDRDHPADLGRPSLDERAGIHHSLPGPDDRVAAGRLPSATDDEAYEASGDADMDLPGDPIADEDFGGEREDQNLGSAPEPRHRTAGTSG